jgi:phytanoyl-CoA hydroxylase
MSLTAAQVREYNANGVLIDKNVLTDADLAPVIAEISAFIDRRAHELFQAGKLTDLAEGLPFETRIGRLYEQCPEITNGLDVMEFRGPRVFEFLHNRNLLDALGALLGPEISCNPIQHLRAKVPSQLGKGGYQLVGWHQDLAVMWDEADHSNIINCWIPLLDATRELGCMEVMPGQSRLGLLEHGLNTEITEAAMPAGPVVVAECPRGGVVFMDKLCPHRGLPNVSQAVRWTLDLRYQVTGQPSGRPFFPTFPVRTRRSDVKLLTHQEWCARWIKALEDNKGQPWHRPAKLAAESAAKSAGKGI